MRKFARVKRVSQDIDLPRRSTFCSAGYDMFAPENVVIKAGETKRVLTGVKAYMFRDEFLLICNRSSNPSKKGLVLMNGVGIVDQDYADNEDNEGEISFEFKNISDKDIEIKEGDKLGQAIFMNYLRTDDDKAEGVRKGGYGSTGM